MVTRFLLGMLCFAVPVSAQQISARASLDSTHYRIGDWIPVHVETEIPVGANVALPIAGDSLGSFEILRVVAGDPVSDGKNRRQTFELRLTTFTAGEAVIPPIEVLATPDGGIPQRVETAPLQVTVATVEVDPQGELKDIKPPLPAPWAFEDLLPWLILATLLGILAAGYAYYARRRKLRSAQPRPSRPALPPYEQALAALRNLEDKRLWQQGRVKEYYSEVTQILRSFFEGQFGIVAMELTSDEILAQLKDVPASLPHWKTISSVLLIADLVKFAKYEPTMAENDAELHMAYAIVRGMRPKPEPQSEEVPADGRR